MDPSLTDRVTDASKFSALGYVLTHAWVLFLSGTGGVVSYIQKVRTGQCSRFNITELIGEIMTSGFAGALTFLFCQASGINLLWTAFLVGVSGHMGARAMLMFERELTKRFDLTPSAHVKPGPPPA